jgi:hypothetical protein
MPIISLITQPATDALQAAYRPVIFLVRASRTDNYAIPPVVYCDIYFNGAYYKTLTKTQYKVLNPSSSDWQFDIQDACQEVLSKVIGPNGGTTIINAAAAMAQVYCKFRSSGYDANGFIGPEGTLPVQATGTSIAQAGSGTQSHSFFVVNSTLQHEHNQDLASHLSAYKTRTWAANAWPLSHRKDLYKIGRNNSDYFPIIYTGTKALTLRLNYKLKGGNTYLTTGSSGGGGGTTCGLVVSGVSVTDYTQTGGNHAYRVTYNVLGGSPALIDLVYSVDGGSTWLNAQNVLVEPGVNAFVYTLADLDARNHIIKIIPYCSASNPGTSGQATYGVSVSAGCIAVSLPSGIAMPDAIMGQPYSYHFSLVGDAPFLFSSVIKPTWMTFSSSGNEVYFTGTPDVQATDISISFNVSNCSGTHNTSFADVIDVKGVPSLTQISNTIQTVGIAKVRNQVFEVGPSVSAGNRYQLICYGHTVEVTAISGDTPNSIVHKLVDAVNATTGTQWNDQGQDPSLTKPTAGDDRTVTIASNRLTLALSTSVQFSSATYIS